MPILEVRLKAVTFEGVERLKYSTVPEPTIKYPTDVLVKVGLSAVCGSDLHVYLGRETGLDAGTIMGHEFVGEIVACGKDVRHFAIGDHIISPFFSSCGGCYYCEHDLSCRCEHGHLFGWVANGEGLQGAQAEYVRVPFADSTLHKLPPGISKEAGVLLCDILPTGFHCATVAIEHVVARSRPNTAAEAEIVAVIGCGPVGLMAIASLKLKGVEQVFALDMIPSRLSLAESFGAVPLNAAQAEAADTIREATSGRGVAAVLEVVGQPAAQQLAYELVRPGGIISVVGVHTSPTFSFSPNDIYEKNLTYASGRCPVQRYLEDLKEPLIEGKFPFSSIFTHRTPLGSAPDMYDIFNRKEDGCVKVVLLPE